MRRTVFALGSLLTVSFVSFGCAPPEDSEPAPQQQEKTKTETSPIIGGTADTTHDAVVFLLSEQGSACSGTIIAKNGSTAWVLTAAHCDGMDYVVMDDNANCLNNNSCDELWFVDSQVVHPNYNGDAGDGYDFSIITFTGANASTPVIPAATSPDGVSNGTMVTMVGYGITPADNTQRRQVTVPVTQTYQIFLEFDQTGGQGSCSGDSGGPALFNNTVVGVTSFGDSDCNEFGVDGRVAAVYNSFIAPIIGGAVVENCDTCFEDEVQSPTGDCAPQVDACLNDTTCAALVDCIGACSTNACIQECANNSTNAAIDMYNAIFDCWCVSCATVCADECDPGSSSTNSTGSGQPAGPGTTGVGGGAAAAGGASANNGGAPSGNGGESNNGGAGAEDGDGGDDGCGCSTVAPDSSGRAFGLLGLAFASVVVARRRRRA